MFELVSDIYRNCRVFVFYKLRMLEESDIFIFHVESVDAWAMGILEKIFAS